ncbi:PREDICTED: E3 ubiquitin-protein ligase Topors isoform X2 [Lupinus angustifolius]|uniref:E3 ubiquitin-protein ligase Topors isoform X2 n=1 Tax=Lupinus angustifolius TaxID=3871 RepID=UPI00092F2FE0|nr:PREDICTED: E3 ubiquitin-protein ligase Topors isoform X2 [Lupinus angustifolius]
MMERRKRERNLVCDSIRDRNCPICLMNLQPRYKQVAVLARCYHAYCTHCIARWSQLRRICPLCNSFFNSWFSIHNLSSTTFRKHFLPPLHDTQSHFPTTTRIVGRRIRRVDRRALQWRRSFGNPAFVTADVIAQRKLEWRASIYNNLGLQPDPTTLRCLETRCKGCSPCKLFVSMLQRHPSPNKSRKDAVKSEILQRIEPWIKRELQAVLGDPDPTVIVHVVTSQFIAWLEEKARMPSGQCDVVDAFIHPLRPFLHDKASTFWHELSCFSESCYNMETYDAVVQYRHLE